MDSRHYESRLGTGRAAARVLAHRFRAGIVHFYYFIRIVPDMDARPMGHSGLAQGSYVLLFCNRRYRCEAIKTKRKQT